MIIYYSKDNIFRQKRWGQKKNLSFYQKQITVIQYFTCLATYKNATAFFSEKKNPNTTKKKTFVAISFDLHERTKQRQIHAPKNKHRICLSPDALE